MKTFDRAFDFTIANEGTRYVNDPDDSGGPTKFGVTLAAYADYVKGPVDPSEIENLTLDDAKAFYQAKYWTPLSCDQVALPGIAMCLFDSGVLYGVGTCALLAQEAIGACGLAVRRDSSLGPQSIKALNMVTESAFIKAFRQRLLDRIDHVISVNPKNEKYRAGWTNRANRLLTLIASSPLNGA